MYGLLGVTDRSTETQAETPAFVCTVYLDKLKKNVIIVNIQYGLFPYYFNNGNVPHFKSSNEDIERGLHQNTSVELNSR